ncbi:hypothetical protein KAH43_02165 [Candidatus Bipolaricaulota bacterium]|nr:hypothetical protein [Candidatus Bipolaricaulota bacterium]
MKVRALIGLLVLVVCAFSAISILADEVEVKDGRVFSGVIKSGVPEFISIDVKNVISTVKRTVIREINYESGDVDVIKTVKGDIFTGSITTTMPDHIMIQTDLGTVTINIADIARITFETSVDVSGGAKSPWDSFWLEGLVGTLGAAGGGLIVGGGGAMIVGLITGGDPYAILPAVCIGYIIGSLAVPIMAVDAVGKAHDVRGNLGLAFVMEVGGGIFGLLLDSALGTPLIFTVLGTGYGAATGYNIGAEIVTQPMAIKQGEIQLVSVGIRF